MWLPQLTTHNRDYPDEVSDVRRRGLVAKEVASSILKRCKKYTQIPAKRNSGGIPQRDEPQVLNVAARK